MRDMGASTLGRRHRADDAAISSGGVLGDGADEQDPVGRPAVGRRLRRTLAYLDAREEEAWG